jgi:hypothetical protein
MYLNKLAVWREYLVVRDVGTSGTQMLISKSEFCRIITNAVSKL